MFNRKLFTAFMAVLLISGMAFAGGSKEKASSKDKAQETQGIDRWHNIYNQPYDPDAVIDSSKNGKKIGPMTITIVAKDGWLFVRDPKKKQLGAYNLKYQCWNTYSPVLDGVDLNLEQFYRSIDLGKTDLNRDQYGNFCGYTGAALPEEYTVTAVAEKPKTGTSTTKPASTGTTTSTGTTASTGTTTSTSAASTAATTATSAGSTTSNTTTSTSTSTASTPASTTTNTSSTTTASTTSSTTTASSGKTGTTSSYATPKLTADSPLVFSTSTPWSHLSYPSATYTYGTETKNKKLLTLKKSMSAKRGTNVRKVNFTTPSKTNGTTFKPTKTPAAREDFSSIDSYVEKLNIPTTMTLEKAAKEITKTAKTDKEKARALFTWIKKNITYDYASVGNPDNFSDSSLDARSAEGTFKNRKGVCDGYSSLFFEFGIFAGLDVDYVSGIVKLDASFTPRGDLTNEKNAHAWNCVHTSNGDILVDCTWGWFDVDPAYMIFSHYPNTTAFQNLSTPLTYGQFQQLPYVDPSLENQGIDGAELLEFFWAHTKAWMPANLSVFAPDARKNGIPMGNGLIGNSRFNMNEVGSEAVMETAGDAMIIYYDDKAKMVTKMPDDSSYLLTNVNRQILFTEKGKSYTTGKRYAVYDWYHQNWTYIDDSFNKNKDFVKQLFANVDSSIDVSRVATWEKDEEVIFVPLSQKKEYQNAIENYEWTRDKEFCEFVEWMLDRGVSEAVIQSYIRNASNPAVRGWLTTYSDSQQGWQQAPFFNSYDFPDIPNPDAWGNTRVRAGGMEKYFQARKLLDHSLWQQEAIPVLFVHFTDTDGSAKTFTPGFDVQKAIPDIQKRVNTDLPNKVECDLVTVPISYNEWKTTNGNGFNGRKKMYDWEREQVLKTLKASNSALAKKLEGRQFAIVEWFDDRNLQANMGNLIYYNNANTTWRFTSSLLRNTLMETVLGVHPKEFPNVHCLNTDCSHGGEFCPLCLYALGY
ncbi:MAG: transglutaminase domain-containing protein [Treponema sp.]|nr:transglutaminase domain-containing protein [Treponema sp.]